MLDVSAEWQLCSAMHWQLMGSADEAKPQVLPSCWACCSGVVHTPPPGVWLQLGVWEGGDQISVCQFRPERQTRTSAESLALLSGPLEPKASTFTHRTASALTLADTEVTRLIDSYCFHSFVRLPRPCSYTHHTAPCLVIPARCKLVQTVRVGGKTEH